MSIVMDLPGESKPARFEPAVWPPQVMPLPETEPVETPAEPQTTPVPEEEPVPA